MTDDNWQVFIDWSGRNALSPVSRRSLRARRESMKRKSSDWVDAVPDGCMAVSDAGDTIGLLFVGIVIGAILLTAAGPFLLGLAFLVVEVTIVLMIAALALVVRTLLGRPWRVVAVSDSGELWSWRQTGWRNTREFESRIHRELSAGAHPSSIAPGAATAEGRTEVSGEVEDALIDRPWFRRLARVLLATIVVIAIVLIVRGFTADDPPASADDLPVNADGDLSPMDPRLIASVAETLE